MGLDDISSEAASIRAKLASGTEISDLDTLVEYELTPECRDLIKYVK